MISSTCHSRKRALNIFVISDGQFLKVSFGLSNSPAVFQRHTYIRAVFRQLITDGTVLVYLDDLIVPVRNEKENLEKLKKMLITATEYTDSNLIGESVSY